MNCPKKTQPHPPKFTPPENLRAGWDPASKPDQTVTRLITPEDIRSHVAALDHELQTEGRRIAKPQRLNYHD